MQRRIGWYESMARYLFLGLIVVVVALAAMYVGELGLIEWPTGPDELSKAAIDYMKLPGRSDNDRFHLTLECDGTGRFVGRGWGRSGEFELSWPAGRSAVALSNLRKAVLALGPVYPSLEDRRVKGGVIVAPNKWHWIETVHLALKTESHIKRTIAYGSDYPEIAAVLDRVESTVSEAAWHRVGDSSVDDVPWLEVGDWTSPDSIPCRFYNGTDEILGFPAVGFAPLRSYQTLEEGEWHFQPVGVCGNAVRRITSLPGTSERFWVRGPGTRGDAADSVRIGVPVHYEGSSEGFLVWSDAFAF